DLGALRTEGHANPDFLSALAGHVGDDAVNADGRKDQSERGKTAEQNHGKTAGGERVRNDFGHALRIVENHFIVKRLQGLAKGDDCRVRRSLGASDGPDILCNEGKKLMRHLQDGKGRLRLNERAGGFVEAPLLDVTYDADDFGGDAEDF